MKIIPVRWPHEILCAQGFKAYTWREYTAPRSRPLPLEPMPSKCLLKLSFNRSLMNKLQFASQQDMISGDK